MVERKASGEALCSAHLNRVWGGGGFRDGRQYRDEGTTLTV